MATHWLIAALYATLLINPALGAHTRINLAVPLLATFASILIARLWQYNPTIACALDEQPELKQAA